MPSLGAGVGVFLLLVGAGSPAGAQTIAVDSSSSHAVTCRWSPRCSTHGVTLEVEERARQGKGAKASALFKATPRGFPPGVPLQLSMRSAMQRDSTVVSVGYVLDSAGNLTCADREAHAELAAAAGRTWCVDAWEGLGVMLMRPAEPMYYMVSTVDGQHRAYATAFLHPIRANQGGCTLEAELIAPREFGFRVSGSGFRPGDSARVEIRSGKELLRTVVAIDSGGYLGSMLVQPAVKGKNGGEATHRVTSSTCDLAVTYPWGNASR